MYLVVALIELVETHIVLLAIYTAVFFNGKADLVKWNAIAAYDVHFLENNSFSNNSSHSCYVVQPASLLL